MALQRALGSFHRVPSFVRHGCLTANVNVCSLRFPAGYRLSLSAVRDGLPFPFHLPARSSEERPHGRGKCDESLCSTEQSSFPFTSSAECLSVRRTLQQAYGNSVGKPANLLTAFRKSVACQRIVAEKVSSASGPPAEADLSATISDWKGEFFHLQLPPHCTLHHPLLTDVRCVPVCIRGLLTASEPQEVRK
ncbi:Zinc metalloproteinase-disintegrin EoVMP2 [Anopheles sinensis]|uniref:Zinc metalloproteinase-disintegrin EoVMP2 n=1 Tax=Anopheles sinensis TaxID=74873 RepID=A0A084VV74_ANOSI|nr:Zinc metalloproteinase-disintegrin EoVMP2 [Anopheles sinensis]